jgi:two-component system response regulator (stage 0 sporulation protein A)
MTINEKVDLLIKYVLEQDLKEIEKLENKLRVAVGENIVPNTENCVEDVIYSVFSEIGIPDHIKGHGYAACAVRLVVENPKLIDNITGKLYPAVADELDTLTKQVESGIRHAIEIMFERIDEKTLKKYFGNTINPETGKVTNGEFIARIANVVRRWS